MCFIPILEGQTINSLLENDFNLVATYCIVFISIVIFVQFNRFWKRYLVRVFGNKMKYKMRKVSMNNLLNKDISYFTENNAGDILNRILADIDDSVEGIRK